MVSTLSFFRACFSFALLFCSPFSLFDGWFPVSFSCLYFLLPSPFPFPPGSQSASAQSVAVGNLGTLAMRQGDRQTAQACLEQHLQLVQQLGDWQGEINAWSKMAQLAATGGGANARGGYEAEGDGGGDAGGVRGDIGPACDGNRSEAGGGVAGTIGQDAVARALWCFERAAALAKTHDEVSKCHRLGDMDN